MNGLKRKYKKLIRWLSQKIHANWGFFTVTYPQFYFAEENRA